MVDPRHGTIAFSRGNFSGAIVLGRSLARLGTRSVVLPIAPYLRDGAPLIPLAPLARGLGAFVSFDAPSKTLSIVLPPPAPIALPSGNSPSVRETAVPIRVEPTPTPRPTVTWIPRPRRTPIETIPSERSRPGR
ncbi:MAG: hypothetical protein JO043_01135 [Candidatus Eremiobacteraeota bacterium]|nr:hypothetical protein [Candidatus Eremiobacteraeota bacterium]